MSNFLERVRVLLGAAPAYLTALAAILAILVDELTDYVGDPVVAWVVKILGVVATIVAVAISIVRRVTPVVESQRGLLPPPTGVPIVPANNPDAGRIDLEKAVVVAAAAVIVVLVFLYLT